MDFASSSSAGPSGSSTSYYYPAAEPCTSGSFKPVPNNQHVAVNNNHNWSLPPHLAAIINDHEYSDRKRLFIYNRTDPHIQCDMRAFYNCMEYEETLQPNYHYFTAIQEELTPFHREQAIDWIYDVAKEENCDGDVFLLAVAIIDRFLSVHSILKHDIQMLAGVSLFIASKVKAPHPMTVAKVIYYSDNSLSHFMILQWELLIVETLRWETESPTAFSFFDFLASRIPQIHNLRTEFQTVVHKCQRMHKLATLFPSMQCAIALYYVSHLPHQNPQLAEHIKNLLAQMFQLEISLLDSYIPMVQQCLSPNPIYSSEPEPQPAPEPQYAPLAEEEETDGDDEQEYEEYVEEMEEMEEVVMESPKEEEQQFDNGMMTPPEEEVCQEVCEEVVVFQEPIFEVIPDSELSPDTPHNDSGFSSDVSPQASSEKKRRRSADWYEDDYTPPKIFKFC